MSEIVERRAELILESAGGPDQTFRLARGSTLVGNGEAAAIRLTDDALEATHVELDWDGTELWLIFLGQGERPLVNGQLVAESQLRSGDRVELGDHVLRVRILRRTRPGAVALADAGAESETGGARDTAQVAEPSGVAVSVDSTQAAPPAVPVDEDPVLLEFSVHQLREQPRRGAIVGVGLVLFFLLMWFWIIPGNVMLMMISMFILLGSVGAFLFPLHYKLTESRVEIRGFPIRDNKKWTRFARYVEFPDAVQLLVSQRDLRGRVIKGSLIYYGDRRDEVMEIVRSKVAKGGPPIKLVRRGLFGRGRKAEQPQEQGQE